MEPLATLYDQHDGRVSQRWSSYLGVLERTLEPIRDRPLRLLEIGVQNGGSLEIWAQYFPNARSIIGSDIDEGCGRLTFDDPRIQVLVGDIAASETQRRIAELVDELDVIIDDGSHQSPDIIDAFIGLYPQLTAGGIYVIEDLHCSYEAAFGGGLFAQRSALGFLRRLVDVVNANHWGLDRSAAEHLQPLTEGPLTAAFVGSLPTIASLEFYDSMCVIRRDEGHQPRLGRRIVVGTEAAITAAPLAEAGRFLPAAVELESAASVEPLAHESVIKELLDDQARRVHLEKELRQEIDELWKRLDRILLSPSYRLMNGPRRLFRALFRRGARPPR